MKSIIGAAIVLVAMAPSAYADPVRCPHIPDYMMRRGMTICNPPETPSQTEDNTTYHGRAVVRRAGDSYGATLGGTRTQPPVERSPEESPEESRGGTFIVE